MALKLHLHANFPYSMERPNAAVGYLKSFLSQKSHLDVTNVYWNLPPREIAESMSSLMTRIQGTHIIDKFDPITVLTAYFARFFYKTDYNATGHGPSIIESIIRSRTTLQKVENTAHSFKEFVDHTIENGGVADADIAGFTVNFFQWLISSYIWSRLKKLNPNITVVVGGLATLDEAVAFVKTFKDVDYAVWGEGELPLKELVSRPGQSLSEVPRLVYREKTGEVISTDTGHYGLETFPFADHTDYFNRIKKCGLTVSVRIPVFGTRSCFWNRCKFCNLNRDTPYYERPLTDIVQEIEYQSQKYNIDQFIFLDTDIGRRHTADFEEVLKALLTSVEKRKRRYDIEAEISPARITRETADMMGKIRIGGQLGFEAMTDTLLTNMDKMHRFAENIQALKLGNDYGVSLFGLNIIRNLPGECEADVVESMENLRFLRFYLHRYELRPSELSLYKGTPYYEDIPAKERETKWVTNFLYSEVNQLGLCEDVVKWDFFGFRADCLNHHQLWDQFTDLLEKMQSSDIFYVWVEFPDGGSLIEEYNHITGNREYVLDEVETRVLKFCDSTTSMQQLKNEFSHVPEDTIIDIVTQLKEEYLLYVDKKGKHIISVFSSNRIRDMHEIAEN